MIAKKRVRAVLNLTILKIVLEVIDKVAVKPYNSSIKSNEGQIRYC